MQVDGCFSDVHAAEAVPCQECQPRSLSRAADDDRKESEISGSDSERGGSRCRASCARWRPFRQAFSFHCWCWLRQTPTLKADGLRHWPEHVSVYWHPFHRVSWFRCYSACFGRWGRLGHARRKGRIPLQELLPRPPNNEVSSNYSLSCPRHDLTVAKYVGSSARMHSALAGC